MANKKRKSNINSIKNKKISTNRNLSQKNIYLKYIDRNFSLILLIMLAIMIILMFFNNLHLKKIIKVLDSKMETKEVVKKDKIIFLGDSITHRYDLKKYYDNINEYNSCNTVNVIKMFLWQNGKPINYSEDKKPRSQDLPDIYAINSAINIISREDMIKYRAFVANKPFLLPVCDIEGLDIDNEIDFEFAEFMYKKYRMNNYVKN